MFHRLHEKRIPHLLRIVVNHHYTRLRANQPSFPTRRSSDLREAGPSCSCSVPLACSSVMPLCPEFPARTASRASRSEEHTSELQSRRDLVCRLLLEKKKHQRLHHAARQWQGL